MPDGLLLVAHGSRSTAGQGEMRALAGEVRARRPSLPVELGYLELCDPPAGPALDRLVAAGCDRIGVVPLMLHAAGHSKSDVPAVVLEARLRHPGVEVAYGRPFGVDHALVSLAAKRIAAVGGAGRPLAVMGRGTSDPDANAEGCRATRLLAESTGAPVVVTGFSGVTWPTVPEALDQLTRLTDGPITVFAWFLATGVLVDRIVEDVAALRRRTGLDVAEAGWFGPDPVLAELALARFDEALGGRVQMNCDACAYRRPFPGLEDRVGQPLGQGHSHLAAEHRH
ncbi:MAG: sirohydrochlorin chelatase [Acidimicrobiales bacterium]